MTDYAIAWHSVPEGKKETYHLAIKVVEGEVEDWLTVCDKKVIDNRDFSKPFKAITCKSCLRLKAVKQAIIEEQVQEAKAAVEDAAAAYGDAQLKPSEEKDADNKGTSDKVSKTKVSKGKVEAAALEEVFDPNEIFKRGVMVTLYVRMWGATSRVNNEEVIASNVPEEVVRAVQDLITQEDKSKLELLRSIKNEAFGVIRRYSLPSPVREFYFVAKKFITEVNFSLLKLQERYNEVSKDISSSIKKMEANFAKAYPKMYKKEKYPTEARLQSMFEFKFNFRVLGVPDQLSELDPEIYKEETAKLKAEFRSMGEDIKNVVATEFMKRIETLKGQCSDNKVNTLTLQSLSDFLGKFETIYDGFVFHGKLKEAIKDIKEYVEGSDSEMFKYSDDYRKLVGQKLAEVSTEIKAAKDIELKREILI